MLLTVLARADAEGLVELFRELVDVAVTDISGDFSRTQIEVVEHPLRDGHSPADDIAAGGGADVFSELMLLPLFTGV